MNVKIKDLMVGSVVTTFKHKSIGHARDIMTRNKIKSLPIVNKENEVEGIITSTDILKDVPDQTAHQQSDDFEGTHRASIRRCAHCSASHAQSSHQPPGSDQREEDSRSPQRL